MKRINTGLVNISVIYMCKLMVAKKVKIVVSKWLTLINHL